MKTPEWVNNVVDRSKDKVIILIKSRLHEEDTSGFIKNIGGFDVIDLPILYTGNIPKSEFINWRKI